MNHNVICIVNYNGNNDTIECLESLFKNVDVKLNRIFLLDNGSEYTNYEEFLNLLRTVCCAYGINYVTTVEKKIKVTDKMEVVLFKNEDNLGFAGGNNILLEAALYNEFKYCTLLNNDTLIDNDGINHIVNFMEQWQDVGACTTNICYNDKRDITWNGGGRLFGGHKFYYTTKQINKWKKQGKKIVYTEFLSGCFMIVRADILKIHGLLSNNFFFGEEDFGFSCRLKRNRIKCVSFLDYKIYHKVSMSVRKRARDSDSSTVLYWVNRFIDIRQQFGKGIKWFIWKNITTTLLYVHYWNTTHNRKIAEEMVEKITRIIRKNDSVSKELTLQIWNNEA